MQTKKYCKKVIKNGCRRKDSDTADGKIQNPGQTEPDEASLEPGEATNQPHEGKKNQS